jgi:hypothetical protein
MVIAKITLFTATLLLIGSAPISIAKEKPLPPNNISCDDFKRTGPNQWVNVRPVTIIIGTSTVRIHFAGQTLFPRFVNLGGNDVAETLERKCGPH